MQHEHSVRSFVLAAALVAGAGACGENSKTQLPPSTPIGEAQPTSGKMPVPTVFTFAPPDGTRYTRTDRRRYETSIVGTPLVTKEEQELRWAVDIQRTGRQYLIDQQLVHVKMKRDNQVTLDADVPRDKIAAKLVTDDKGNLVDVRGLESTSQALQGLVGPGMDETERRSLTPQGLKSIVAMRYSVLTGDTVGRPAKTGASWIAPGRSNGLVLGRTISVEAMEPCGQETCARLHQQIELDPVAVFELADHTVKEYVRSLGGDPGAVKAKTASYAMAGTIVTDPSTMLNHAASLSENGHVTVQGPKQTFDVALSGNLDYVYEYAPGPIAHGLE